MAISYEQIFRSLARHSHVFPLHSDNVTIIHTPTAFYEQLLTNIRNAKHRITISSLYLGTGPLEQRLVECIGEAMRANPQLQVTVVLDHSRGQRGGQTHSSVAMCKSLLMEFSSQFQLFLYKVPQLKGIKAKLPPPFNETIGVSHAKVYLIDDTLILSGANLSEDYFTNRQDRYVQMTQSPGLAAFYHTFVQIVSTYAYEARLEENKKEYILVTPQHEGQTQCETRKRMKVEFEALMARQEEEEFMSENVDTWAFPTLQFTPIDVKHDERILTELLPQLPSHSWLGIASGYLNFPPFLENLLIRSHVHIDVLTAAPVANGFFHASGIKGALPMAYSLIEQDFYEHTRTRPFSTTIREYMRPSWTFHGKGMWLSPSPTSPPPLTIIGSSNFGRRSYGCDLEAQMVLYTQSSRLQSHLQQEFLALTQQAEIVTEQVWKRPDRSLNRTFCWQYGYWIRPISKLIAAYL